MKNFDQLFQHEIAALIMAKRKFVEALRLLNESISCEEMKERITAHLFDTLKHIEGLQDQFRTVGGGVELTHHELSNETDVQEVYEILAQSLTDRKTPAFNRINQSPDLDFVGLRKIYE